MPDETPVSLRELRTFCYWSSCYLSRVAATTPVPQAERMQTIIRELREMVFALPDETPKVE